MGKTVTRPLENEPRFHAHYTPAMVDKRTAQALGLSPFARNRKILAASTLGDAVKGCDVYAKTKVVFGPMALG
jgi:ATP-dependent helicase IRC3